MHTIGIHKQIDTNTRNKCQAQQEPTGNFIGQKQYKQNIYIRVYVPAYLNVIKNKGLQEKQQHKKNYIF